MSTTYERQETLTVGGHTKDGSILETAFGNPLHWDGMAGAEFLSMNE